MATLRSGKRRAVALGAERYALSIFLDADTVLCSPHVLDAAFAQLLVRERLLKRPLFERVRRNVRDRLGVEADPDRPSLAREAKDSMRLSAR